MKEEVETPKIGGGKNNEHHSKRAIIHSCSGGSSQSTHIRGGSRSQIGERSTQCSREAQHQSKAILTDIAPDREGCIKYAPQHTKMGSNNQKNNKLSQHTILEEREERLLGGV
jgi:hypothetical protein